MLSVSLTQKVSLLQGQFSVAPQALISGPGPGGGPAFCVGCRPCPGKGAACAEAVSFENLQINGQGSAFVIRDVASLRMRNVNAMALRDTDNVNTSQAGCDGCNRVMGSWNAAVVVENSFWLW